MCKIVIKVKSLMDTTQFDFVRPRGQIVQIIEDIESFQLKRNKEEK